VLDTSVSRAAGAFSLAGEIEAHTGGTPLMLSVYEAVGLTGGVDLVARQGFGLSGDHAVYLGGALKWTLLHDKAESPGLAVWAGGHYITAADVAGADATLLIDHRFGRFTPYAALDMDLDFFSGGSELFLDIIGGARIGLSNRVAWFVEGGLGIAGDVKQNFVSTGPRISI
jgi:hypothetical protein